MSAPVAAPPGRGPIPGGPVGGPPPPTKSVEPTNTRQSSKEHGGSAPSDFGGKPPDPKDYSGSDGKMDKDEAVAFKAASTTYDKGEKNKADVEKAHIKAEADMYKAQVKGDADMHKTDKTAEVEHHRINNDNKMSKTFGK